MYKNVFINKNNEVNVNGMGRLVDIRDLIDDMCIGNKNLPGLIQTTEGVYLWHDNMDDKSVEDVDEICEYIKVSEETNQLYDSLMLDVNARGLEIIKCNLTKDCLTSIVQDFKQEFIYMFNIWINDETGEIINNETMMSKNVLMNSLNVA